MEIKRLRDLSLYLMGASLQLSWLPKWNDAKTYAKEQSVIRARNLLPTTVALCFALNIGGIVSAQNYPQRPIKISCRFQLGGKRHCGSCHGTSLVFEARTACYH